MVATTGKVRVAEEEVMEQHTIVDFEANYLEDRGLQPWYWYAGCMCGNAAFTGYAFRLSGAMIQARARVHRHMLENRGPL